MNYGYAEKLIRAILAVGLGSLLMVQGVRLMGGDWLTWLRTLWLWAVATGAVICLLKPPNIEIVLLTVLLESAIYLHGLNAGPYNFLGCVATVGIGLFTWKVVRGWPLR